MKFRDEWLDWVTEDGGAHDEDIVDDDWSGEKPGALTLVELCCGSAAVTLRLLGGPGCVPPCGYMGGKRRYAAAILDVLGIRGQHPGRVILCDAGPWGRAWSLLRDREIRAWVVDELRHMATRPEKGRDLFNAIASRPPAVGAPTWAADFLALQGACVGTKPVSEMPGRWRTSGYASLSPQAVAKHFSERLLPDAIADRVEALAAVHWPRVEVMHGDVRDVSPIPGATVYVDPDYQGTTGYPASLPRADLLALAQRWADAGAVVAISEAEPLDLPGWHHVEIQALDGWQQQNFGTRREWLTLNREPARVVRQESLALDGAA